MTDTDQLLAAYDDQLRGAGEPGPGTVHEYDGRLLRVTGGHQGFLTAPRDLGVRGDELDALIARQRDHFAARGESVEWKTRGHDEPADLTDRLVAAGFVPEGRETVIVGHTADLATDPVLPAGVTLRQTADPADLHRIGAMETAVWGRDMSFLGDFLVHRTTAEPDGIVVLVAEADGEVVSAAWLMLRNGVDFAGLWGGSTLSEWRGRGIYRALVARRAQLAAERGYKYLHVDASDDSSPILQRLGLRAVTTTTPYVWSPPAA
ncbi:GNAT family N-acetyltransferase [Kitasatospora sp. MAP5-34]|uniref:GNAT family N-acetyltransferase n=1 Tax=Kitasatospora sp. MAP5-34 TaxID=3035102 RepID=UPI0024730052|nr:GNAT family N-acetyltransferase [Kitasatospora sp. MAP5-34]MDH6574954.1 GNAT superfamily N-acetyltransferase [Kitasatospora sp. MAP5-34]